MEMLDHLVSFSPSSQLSHNFPIHNLCFPDSPSSISNSLPRQHPFLSAGPSLRRNCRGLSADRVKSNPIQTAVKLGRKWAGMVERGEVKKKNQRSAEQRVRWGLTMGASTLERVAYKKKQCLWLIRERPWSNKLSPLTFCSPVPE